MKQGWHQKFKRATKEARTSRDGDTFDSKTELMRWEYLRQLERIGEIRNLQRQVKYNLRLPNGVAIMTGKRMAVYTADFVYDDVQKKVEIIEDVKGFFDKASKFRIAVFMAIYQKDVSLVTLKNRRWAVEYA